MSEQTNTIERKPWELTPDEIWESSNDGYLKWVQSKKAGTELTEYNNRAIATAAVKKVAEWMIANNTANSVEKYNGWPMQLDEEHWESFRQEVGL